MVDAEQRRHARIHGYAKVVFRRDAAPGYIRDLSESGCKVDFLRPLSISKGDLVELEVIPEQEMGIAPFRLCLKTQWVSAGPVFFSIGGRRETSLNMETEGLYQKLADYYCEDPGKT
jgi:hypothetical protein